MARFLEQALRHSFEGPYVMFDVIAKMKFQPDEIGKKWQLETIIIEKDRITPDDVFRDHNWSRTFIANQETVSLEIHVPIQKSDMNTEPGKEEVYAKLKVVPLEGDFPVGEAITNMVEIDV
ncbi:MAG: hypothetical protein HWN65_15880 [Candidatus Helarchaeota archaeon]|nr:hypothetical protein [Candidatus Helarchaeota archaeon]